MLFSNIFTKVKCTRTLHEWKISYNISRMKNMGFVLLIHVRIQLYLHTEVIHGVHLRTLLRFRFKLGLSADFEVILALECKIQRDITTVGLPWTMRT